MTVCIASRKITKFSDNQITPTASDFAVQKFITVLIILIPHDQMQPLWNKVGINWRQNIYSTLFQNLILFYSQNGQQIDNDKFIYSYLLYGVNDLP